MIPLVDGSFDTSPDPGADLVPFEIGAPDAPRGVVGGEVVPDGVWPDVVALYTIGDDFACTGVLIAPDLVLTAGHCGFALGAALVGTANLARGGRAVEIADTLVHEDYLHTLDVAVVFLSEPVEDIPPRPLAVDCFAARIAPGSPVAVVGFGAIDLYATQFVSELHGAETTVSDPVCVDFAAGCHEEVSPGGELIAGGAGVDSCAGDSGGPLYLLGTDQDTLAGVTSRGLLTADLPCGDGGIYARADAVDAWLQDQGIELDRPFCGGNQPPVPDADLIEVVRGSTAAVWVDPRDPDDDQQHAWSIVASPAVGQATLDPRGYLVYLAPDLPADASVTIEVTDDGEPPMSGQITVPIRVIAGGGDDVQVGGCATTPAAVPWAALAALAWLRRPVTGRRCRTPSHSKSAG